MPQKQSAPASDGVVVLQIIATITTLFVTISGLFRLMATEAEGLDLYFMVSGVLMFATITIIGGRNLLREFRLRLEERRRIAAAKAVELRALERRAQRGARVIYAQNGPVCHKCGKIMIRNGSCFKCLNCGSTSGCS